MDPETFKAVVLNAAIQGKLVPQDPNDEPASVLVERIREERQRLIKVGKMKKDKSESFIFRRGNHYYESNNGSESLIDEEFSLSTPETWELVRIKNLGLFGGGKTPSTSIGDYWGGDINWVSSKEVKTKYIGRTERTLTKKGADSLTLYPSQSIVFVMRSGILRRTFPVAILSEESTVNQDIKVLQLSKYVDSEYLYYTIRAREEFILKKCSKDGTTVESIDDEKLKQLIIPLPPYAEQKRICNMIKSYDFLADIHQSIINYGCEIKQELTQSFLIAAIQGRLIQQDPCDEPVHIQCKNPIIRRDNSYYETIRGKEVCIDDEIKYPVPNNWVLVRGKDIILENIGGGTPSKNISNYWNGSIKWASVRDLQSNRLFVTERTITQDGLDNSSSNIVPKGSIIICIRVGLGKIAICDDDIAINQDLRGLILSDQILPDYFIIFYQFIDIEGSGTTVKGVKKSFLDDVLIPIPPIKEQQRIVDKLQYIKELTNQLSD